MINGKYVKVYEKLNVIKKLFFLKFVSFFTENTFHESETLTSAAGSVSEFCFCPIRQHYENKNR